ncbi:hypothetical protein [Nocardia sp. NPDC003963]
MTRSATEEAGTSTEPEVQSGPAQPAPPDDGDTGTDAAGDPVSRRPRIWRRAALAALVLGLVATTVLSVLLGRQWQDRRDIDRAAAAALGAAQQYAVVLTSIDATHIDQDFAAIEAGATGEFKDMYAQSAQNLRPLLVEARSVSRGQVIAASIRSAARDEVVVMLFVDAEITNTTMPAPRIDRNRILMTMNDIGGRWLASRVELV